MSFPVMEFVRSLFDDPIASQSSDMLFKARAALKGDRAPSDETLRSALRMLRESAALLEDELRRRGHAGE
jgi:hypothetical protein